MALDALIRMANIPSPEQRGEPALKIAGFQLWVTNRQFPDASDYDDGNWLLVAAHCGEEGASVWAEGALLQAQDIDRFRKDCQKLLKGEARKVTMEPLEPNLHIEIEATDKLGHFEMRVQITPNHLTQEHRFEFGIDQSYLPGIIGQCERLTERFSVRGV